MLDANVELKYTPRRATSCGAHFNIPMALQVFDLRSKDDRIGVKKNGVGIETADVKLDRSGGIVSWFRDAMRKELQGAGFQVLEPGRGAGAYLRVSARLKQLFAEAQLGTGSKVHALVLAELEVIFVDGKRFARLFKGYETGSFILGTGGEIESTLLAAAQKALGKATRGLCGLLALEARQ